MKTLWRRLGCALVGCRWGGWVPLMICDQNDRRRAMRQCFHCRQLVYQYAAPGSAAWGTPGWPQRMED